MNRPHRRTRIAASLLLLLIVMPPAGVPAADPAAAVVSSGPTTNGVIIPFEYRRGHVLIPGTVAGTNLQFILDTGYSLTMLPPGLGDTLQLRRTGHVTIVGIAGEEEAGVFDGPQFDFKGLSWSSRRVAAFPPSENGRGRRREGILGSGFFRRFVVVIDQNARQIELADPGNFNYSGNGEIVPLKFRRGSSTPIITATVTASSNLVVSSEFELDTGCDSCLCLGSEFSTTNHLIPQDSRSSSRSGVGGGTRTRAGRLASLRLGQFQVERPSTEFFIEGSPAGTGLAGHIGLEALRDFRAIFDYSRQRLILERPPAPPPRL